MDAATDEIDAARLGARRLFVYSGSFLLRPGLRRLLRSAGWEVTTGWPGPGDRVGVWGQRGTARRGQWVARRTGSRLLTIEDALFRSLFPGRVAGRTLPLGIWLDDRGVHYDPARPSAIETLLSTHPLNDPALLARAGAARDFIARNHLSKYAATLPSARIPDAPPVLIIDQARGDASLNASGANRARFREMLSAARTDHPDAPILIKTHPETRERRRPGHFTTDDLDGRTRFLTAPVSPTTLFAAARAVYTVSSGLGFEAILHGHRPQVWGGPFYAGWGLSTDRMTLPRRGRRLSPDQLAAAALILAPVWYCPIRDCEIPLEDALYALAAQARAWREDRAGWTTHRISAWKRPHIRRFFATPGPATDATRPQGAPQAMSWASKTPPEESVVRVEDGFLRSRGLGAALTPPVSLVLDDLGIHYDPSRESRLERLIADSPQLPEAEISRANRLIARILACGLTKYGLAGSLPDLPPGRRILVVGQVPGDASLRYGAGPIADDADLLRRARAAEPGAFLIYKPHPDILAGHRKGRLAPPNLADLTLADTDPAQLLGQVDGVWTMTSLLGFEALLRGVPVTVTGAPFYAGWGLTRDLGPVPARRRARPSMAQLAHAALIGYPRYSDPVTAAALSPEAAVARLSQQAPEPMSILAALQRLRARIRLVLPARI